VNTFLAEVSLQAALQKRKTVNVKATKRRGAVASGPATSLVTVLALPSPIPPSKSESCIPKQGTLALTEVGPIQGELLAIKEINEQGGVLAARSK